MHASSPVTARLGPFVVREVLGEGGTGTVYASELGGRPVALKVLRADLALTEKETTRFLREAEKMRKVAHPGLVALLDVGFLPDGRPYLCMPLIAGETLAKRLARGPFRAAEAIAIFEKLAAAVEALHEAGLLHRDIKPENIVLEGDGQPVLLDLGIARAIDGGSTTTETQHGRVRGTMAYMAPERFFGAPASVATDVYELAVTLYMLLTGVLPWRATGAAERLHPTSPRAGGADVSEGLATVILRGLSTRPEARPPTVRAFLDQVRAATAGGAASASRQTADLPIDARGGSAPDVGAPAAETAATTTLSDATPKRSLRTGALTFLAASVVAVVTAVAISPRRPSAAPAPSSNLTATFAPSDAPSAEPPASVVARSPPAAPPSSPPSTSPTSSSSPHGATRAGRVPPRKAIPSTASATAAPKTRDPYNVKW